MGKVDKSLDPCPVCGKYPNLIRYTNICTIKCKRLFKHAHLSVTVGGDDYKEAYKNTAELWNFEVNKMIE